MKGRIVAHLGKALIVEGEDGLTARCKKRTQLQQPAVGDDVEWMKTEEGAGRVEKILERRSLLSRPAKNGQTRPVAANLDQIVAILAVKPNIDPLLLDQYLIVSEFQGIRPLIVLNKVDLLDEKSRQNTDELILLYRSLDYEVIEVSAVDKTGLDTLRERLKDQTSILVGQSGVGKSTITNALLPDLDIQTKALSTASGLGKHTTTSSTLYKLPEGGDIIDSPGVNIFGLAHITEHNLAYGYREIKQLADQCKYSNCLHLKEPKCAVKDGVESGSVSKQRYLRYLKLRDKLAY
ncbi:MAG: ribosome small subunit-dependent GTPase A [Cycloclasticus sp.]|jgi:ribosome biogenesis GTPase|nr:ribosome small subunit-dependent GTPase A [Cycloclasticus sp.]MDF1690109.1 ribosome small subunit-dependent GTPase A [Cycloclasticus sp.]MEE4290435.1 ribosome small subunit-dependent GTPase A [Cycloclasticus sp.]